MQTSQQENVFDLIGLGFGPANIAVAGALTEHWQDQKNANPTAFRKVLFIEKYTQFCWHPGMLLPDARMQISFMKDLATLRNPQSRYTFLSYLHSQGRLLSFINRGSTIPTRKEYSDYLSWAAAEVQDNGIDVLFGHEILSISSAAEDTIAIRYRSISTGEETVIKTRNFIISPGGSPRIPAFLKPLVNHPSVLHSSRYATSIDRIFENLSTVSRQLRVAVIGSGQSAAEVTMDLRARLSNMPVNGRHTVEMLIRKGSLKPSDDSPFANEIFDPESTEDWYNLTSRHLRDMRYAEYKPTNYGVVNPRTIDTLYEIIYDQKLKTAVASRLNKKVECDAWIEIKTYTQIVSIKANKSSEPFDLLLSPEQAFFSADTSPLIVETQNIVNRSTTEEQYDVIVYATGYERGTWVNLLKYSDVAAHFGLNSLTRRVRLVPTGVKLSSQPSSSSNSGASSPSNPSSTHSSPPTSPELGLFSSSKEKASNDQEIHISRNYRLLPSGYVENPDKKHFTPRIYLQGVEEQTHGLSDTLLSVLGVRAGEVVQDLTLTT